MKSQSTLSAETWTHSILITFEVCIQFPAKDSSYLCSRECHHHLCELLRQEHTFSKINICFTFTHVYMVMCICHVYTGICGGHKRSLDPLESGVTESCELPNRDAANWTQVLWNKHSDPLSNFDSPGIKSSQRTLLCIWSTLTTRPSIQVINLSLAVLSSSSKLPWISSGSRGHKTIWSLHLH